MKFLSMSDPQGSQKEDGKHRLMQGSTLLTCLELCGLSIQDITQTNSANLIATAYTQPPLPYKEADEFIARVTRDQKNPSLTVIKNVCKQLTETKSSTAVYRLPFQRMNDAEFIKKHKLSQAIPKLTEQSSINQLMSPQPVLNKTFSKVLAGLVPELQQETALKTIQHQIPDLRSLSGFNADESKKSQDHKKQVEFFPYVKRMKRSKIFEEFKRVKLRAFAGYKERGETPPLQLENEIQTIAELEKKGEQPPDYMLQADTSSNSDSLISVGGVNKEDVENLVDNNLREDVTNRRVRRQLLKSKRTLDKQAIEDVLGTLGKFKSTLSQSDEEKTRRRSVVGTKFQNNLSQLKEKFKNTLLFDSAKDSTDKIPAHLHIEDVDNSIHSLLHQMQQETEPNIFEYTPYTQSRLLSPQQSTISYHAEVLRRKKEMKARLKAFNIHHTTQPGFGQSKVAENCLKAKFVRLKALNESPNVSEKQLVVHNNETKIQQHISKITEEMQHKKDDFRKLIHDITLTSEQLKKRKNSEASVPDLAAVRSARQAKGRNKKSKYFSDIAFIRRELENQTVQIQDIKSALLVKQCSFTKSKLKITPSSEKTSGQGDISEPQLTVSIMKTHNTVALSPIAPEVKFSTTFRMSKINNQSDLTLLALNTGNSRESQMESDGVNQRSKNVSVVQHNQRILNVSELQPQIDQEIKHQRKASVVNVTNLSLVNVPSLVQKPRALLPSKMIHVNYLKMNADIKTISNYEQQNQSLRIAEIASQLQRVDRSQGADESSTVNLTRISLPQSPHNKVKNIEVASLELASGQTHQDEVMVSQLPAYMMPQTDIDSVEYQLNSHAASISSNNNSQQMPNLDDLEFAVQALQPAFKQKRQSPKKGKTVDLQVYPQMLTVARYNNRVYEPSLPIICENEQENVTKTKVDITTNTTQLTHPNPTFSNMGLNTSSFDFNLNSNTRPTPEPRKILKVAKVLSPKNVLAQRRPTHQEASSIYFMAQEDIFREMRADVDTSRQSSHRRCSVMKSKNEDYIHVTKSKGSPRPVLSKLGGGFLNNNKAFRNTFTSALGLNEAMFFTANSDFVKTEIQTDSGLTETNSVVEEITSFKQSQIKPNFQIQFRVDKIHDVPTGFQQFCGQLNQTTQGIPMNRAIFDSNNMDNESKGSVIGILNQTKQKKPQAATVSLQQGVKYEPSIFADQVARLSKLPVVFGAQSYKKKQREKPNTEFQDFQYMKLSNEPLTRILGTENEKKKVKQTTERKLDLGVFGFNGRDLPGDELFAQLPVSLGKQS